MNAQRLYTADPVGDLMLAMIRQAFEDAAHGDRYAQCFLVQFFGDERMASLYRQSLIPWNPATIPPNLPPPPDLPPDYEQLTLLEAI